MKRIGNFFKSILPILLVLVLQALVAFLVEIVYAIIPGTSSGSANSDVINFTYGAAAFFIFLLWYRHAFLVPNKNKRKADASRGFSFRNVLAMLLLGIGLYYVTSLIVDILSSIWPELLANYNAVMADEGFTNPSILLILYSVVLAPVVEEVVFRGLTYRFARRAMPFWPANIWQALLFGLLHFNLLQGIYAFAMGLFLGYVCHRGRGVRYSVFVHIVFNVIGLFFSGLVGITLESHYAVVMICGVALTVFATWLFSTAFPSQKESASGR